MNEVHSLQVKTLKFLIFKMFGITFFFMFFLSFGGPGFNRTSPPRIKSNISKDFGDSLRKGTVLTGLFVNSSNFLAGIHVQML